MTVGAANPAAVTAEQKLEPVAHQQTGRTSTSRLAQTDQTLLGRTDADPVPVIVKLDHDPVASYRGGIAGYVATSPAATGRSLRGDTAEVAYEEYLAKQERKFTDALEERVPTARIGHRLRTVYGGVALIVPANRIKDLLEIESVVAVHKDELRQTLTDSSTQFIGVNQIGNGRDDGRGVIVGVLDTGAWPEHPSFADQGDLGEPPPLAGGKTRTCDFGDGFKCNNKLISGEMFLESYLTVHKDETFKTARDSDGHGTHTASTAAGNMLDSAKVFGVERGPVRGVAPAAWISVYKVCGLQGCMSSDATMAVAQAIRDGVRVINYSISGGVDPFTDPVEMAFLDAYAAGVFVAASAGNSGPGPGTVNHVSPWVTTVAASTQRRAFSSTLTLDNGESFTGASITAGVGPAPVARNGKCLEPAKPGTFAGKIVLCERGVNARAEKGWNVKKGGAVGMILYNPTLQDVGTDNHWLPTIHLPDDAILSHLDGSASDEVKATIGPGERVDGQADVMAAFSSRGPGGLSLKPDVTAPGMQILAGHTPVPDNVAGGPEGEQFQAIAGTSMSSPHVAGSAALLAARHPLWTPGQLKSALMTTAVTDLVKEDLTTAADPLDFGAGRIAVDKAITPGLTVSDTAIRMWQFAGDALRAVDLNLPSINIPVMPGRVTTSRTFVNDTAQSQTYAVKTSGDDVTADRSQVAIPPGGSASIKVTVSSRANDSKWRFGHVSLTPQGADLPPLHLPVAYRAAQGKVALTSTCEPAKVTVGGSAQCRIQAVNDGYDDTTVTVSSTFDASLRPMATPARTAALPGIRPGVPNLSTVDGRRFKKLDVDPDPIGDEEMITYDVPAFTYAGQRHHRLSVTSNGYLVVGEGSGQDILPEAPERSSDERPNNVLAPYWADLDGTGEQGIRVASLHADGRKWIVIDWHVKHFGTADRVNFQVWLAAGNTEEIRFTYGKSGSGGTASAENALGQGESRPASRHDVAVKSTGGRAGGTLDYTLTVQGVSASPDSSFTTSMTSQEVPGTTVVHTRLPVRRH